MIKSTWGKKIKKKGGDKVGVRERAEDKTNIFFSSYVMSMMAVSLKKFSLH
jgi:hypothetical protein